MATSIAVIMSKTTTTISGISSATAPISPRIIVCIDSTIRGMFSAIFSRKAVKASTIATAILGSISITAEPTTPIAAAIAAALPAIATKPVAASSRPRPIRAAPAPIRIIARPRAISVGTTGVNINPANPNITKVAAKPTSAIANSSQLNVDKSLRAPAIAKTAILIRIIAAAPARAPDIRFAAITNISKARPIPTRPRNNSSQVIAAKVLTASAMISKAADMTVIARAAESIPLGCIKRENTAKPPRTMPMLCNPCVKVSTSILPNIVTDLANSFKEKAISVIAEAALRRSLSPIFDMIVSEATSIAKEAVIARRP